MVCLVEERKDAREDSNAIEGMFLGSNVNFWKCSVLPQGEQARRESQNKGFDVWEGAVPSSANIDWREEAEDIFAGFRKLPELVVVIRLIRPKLPESSLLSNMDHLPGYSQAQTT